MAIRRRCNGRTCKNGRRCLEHLWFDVMYRGMRFRMPANEFANGDRRLPTQHPDRLGNAPASRAWDRARAGENGRGLEPRTAGADRSSLARPPARRRVLTSRRRRRHPHHSADARPREHPADAALFEHNGRGAQERTGDELEQQAPTASTRHREREVISRREEDVRPARLSQIGHMTLVRLEIWLRGGV